MPFSADFPACQPAIRRMYGVEYGDVGAATPQRSAIRWRGARLDGPTTPSETSAPTPSARSAST